MKAVRILYKAIACIAAFGLFCGALVMATEGTTRIVEAGLLLWKHESAHTAVAPIMAATDEFLFALVLCLMSAAIIFNSLFDPGQGDNAAVPQWLVFHDIAHIKHTLVEVILVYLIVDFATDIAEISNPEWSILLKPAAILAIAAASRVMKS